MCFANHVQKISGGVFGKFRILNHKFFHARIERAGPDGRRIILAEGCVEKIPASRKEGRIYLSHFAVFEFRDRAWTSARSGDLVKRAGTVRCEQNRSGLAPRSAYVTL